MGGRGGCTPTFVSSRTRFCSLRARASCVSRFFLSSSSWALTWRTSSCSCCLTLSSSRALHRGAAGQSVRPGPRHRAAARGPPAQEALTHGPKIEPHVQPAAGASSLLNSYSEPFRSLCAPPGPRRARTHGSRRQRDRGATSEWCDHARVPESVVQVCSAPGGGLGGLSLARPALPTPCEAGAQPQPGHQRRVPQAPPGASPWPADRASVS